jgi:nitroreductase
MSARLDPAPKKPRTVDGWFVADAKFPSDPIGRLIYYARLAPSAHNSQPWKFVAGASEIDVFADPARWLPAMDPRRRELHISLGCAIETIRIAADFGGWGSEVSYFPVQGDHSLVARVHIAFGGPKREDSAADLLQHMITRHTSHKLFDPARPVVDTDRQRLYRCFLREDVSLHFVKERAQLDALAAMELRADETLLGRADYRKEAIGQLAGVIGMHWLLSKLAQKDSERLASAPLVAVLTTRRDRALDQIQVGEAFMRIALVAEAHGVRVQPMSQVLEVAEAQAELARLFELGERVPQHLFRLGHAEAETGGPSRRPLEELLVRTG